MHQRASFLFVACLLTMSALALAQPNIVVGTDVSLGILGTIETQARTGTYPNGVNGVVMETTSCNLGTVNVPWQAAMLENHPFIAFMAARLGADGKFVQISDRSYIKHGFYALSNSQCIPCQNPSNGTFLGVGCSDTYATSNNGDSYWLAPPQEVNPFTGIWIAAGSHFDRGEPAVTGAAATDGQRSLNQTMVNNMGPVAHKMRIRDSELGVSGATYFYQGHYIVRGEPLAVRTNNLCSRRFTAAWTGTSWNIQPAASNNVQVSGTILNRWTGATVTSGTNGTDDGRVHVGVLVTGPNASGLYRYDYAVHNQDNNRGVRQFTLPTCNGAQVLNLSFRDVDTDPANDWTSQVSGGQITWSCPTFAQNPNANYLGWNSFFNFSFDSDAAPVTMGTASLGAYLNGNGAASFGVTTTVPAALYNVSVGTGCTTYLYPPVLTATGTPARATLGNTTFGLSMNNLLASSTVYFFLSVAEINAPLNAQCSVFVTGTLGLDLLAFPTTANSLGIASIPAPVPMLPVLEGATLMVQAAQIVPSGFGAFANLHLSNGLRLRLGSNIGPCP